MRVVITGANRGLGFALVDACLKRGYDVYACYRKDPGKLSTLHSKTVSYTHLTLPTKRIV